MKRACIDLTLIYTCFLLLLILSGSSSGDLSTIYYYLAFAAPALLGIILIYRERGKLYHGSSLLSFNKRHLPITLLSISPAIALIIASAALTALVMEALGFTNPREITGSLPIAILLHALFPAVLEELLFRYIPLRMLLPHSPRYALIISSVFFAVIHTNLFQIPYALVAGVLFALLDIWCESIYPSLIIHFCNNTLSIISMKYPESSIYIYISVGVLALICALIIFFKRKRVTADYSIKLQRGNAEQLPIGTYAFIAAALFIAVTNLL